MSELVTISESATSNPEKETDFGRFLSHSFSHYPKLRTTDEGWNIDQLVNQECCLQTQLSLHHNSPVLIRLSISGSILPPLVYRTPRYLKSFTLGRNSLRTESESTIFWQSTMGSDLGVLNLVFGTLPGHKLSQ